MELRSAPPILARLAPLGSNPLSVFASRIRVGSNGPVVEIFSSSWWPTAYTSTSASASVR